MKKVEITNKVVNRDTGRQAPSSGKGASMDLSAYLIKSVWDEAFEVRQTESGEKYLFGKLPVALQYDLSAYVDGGFLDLPSIYDGLPIDQQTIYWEEVDGVKVLKAKGSSGEGAISNVYVSGSGNAITGAELSDDKKSLVFTKGETFITSSALEEYATKTWVGNNYFSINGGQLEGDLWLRKGSENYGRTIYFGDKSYAYIQEDTDDHLKIYGSQGLDLLMGSSYYLNVSAKGIKLNGGTLTYNSSSGYWELEGDLLVNGGITSTE